MISQYPDPLAAPVANPAPTDNVVQTEQPVARQVDSKPKKSLGLLIGVALVALLVGGLGGYLIGDFLFFRPALQKESDSRQALAERLAALESSIDNTDSTSTSMDTQSPSSGTGGVEISQGITPDSVTVDWPVYSNPGHHFSFKYPANYEVRELATEEKNLIFNVGVFQKGGVLPAAFVRVYNSTANKGPRADETANFLWPPLLPTSILEKTVGAGLVKDVSTKDVTLNGSAAIELGAIEGSQLVKKQGGQSYQAYSLPDIFDASYLVGTCGSDQTDQNNLVACALLTTFKLF